MTQKDAVFRAVLAVMGDLDGQKAEPTKEEREQIISIVAEGIQSGEVSFSEDAQQTYHTPELVREYTASMVSNWLRKDLRLNGGEEYKPKNPGSRTGMSDPEVKNLKLLLKSGKLTTKEQEEKVKARIDQKVQALKAEKAKVEIDFDVIPDDLKAELGLEE